MNCKYTYSELKNKYQDFHTPFIDIEINGKKIKTVLASENKKNQSLKTDYVKINLSLEKSSMAKIQVSDIYDYSGSSFSETVSIGSSIKIMLGYSGSCETVFYGYIAGLDYEFRNGFHVIITAFDALSLMEQQNCPKYYNSKSHSDIVNEIINGYSSLILKKSFDNLSISREFVSREEKISDLQFIRRLCRECGRIFYISAGEAVITDKPDEKPCINLDIHEALKSFRLSERYQNSIIKVTGFDSQKFDSKVSGEYRINISRYQNATASPQTRFFTAPEISQSSEAEKYAEYIGRNIMKNINTGTVHCIGLPEIKTGCCITLSGISKSGFDTFKYNVSEVVHSIDSNGFNTSITINGWS